MNVFVIDLKTKSQVAAFILEIFDLEKFWMSSKKYKKNFGKIPSNNLKKKKKVTLHNNILLNVSIYVKIES